MLNLRPQPDPLGVLLGLILSLAAAGCGGDSTGPATGSIQVSSATTGGTLDPDGYSVTVGNSSERAIGVNESLTLEGIPVGDHTVQLTGVAANCAVQGQNPRNVSVTEGETTSTTFAVTCSLLTGNLEVTTSTSGQTIDADGFGVRLDGGSEQSTDVNATLTLSGVPAGARSVELTGVSANCKVGGDNPRTVDVPVDGTASTTFTVTCAFALRNQIVFASNRDGNFELYVMNTDGSSLLRLTNDPGFDARPAISPDGTKIAFETNRDGNHEIYVMNADGTGLQNLTDHPAFDEYPAWSPDGSKIVFDSDRQEGTELYVMNSLGRNVVRLTDSPGSNLIPAWSPDGTQIAFVSSRGGCCEIFVMNADGTDQEQLTGLERNLDPAWSPNGRSIAFDSNRDGNWEIYLMNPDGTELVNVTTDGSADEFPAWSPDGRRIAFDSNRDGNFEIYLMDPDGRRLVRLTNDPAVDSDPVWSP